MHSSRRLASAKFHGNPISVSVVALMPEVIQTLPQSQQECAVLRKWFSSTTGKIPNAIALATLRWNHLESADDLTVPEANLCLARGVGVTIRMLWCPYGEVDGAISYATPPLPLAPKCWN